MFTKTFSASPRGISAHIIGVEVDASAGVPGFGIVGLPDKSTTEAKERISVAMRSSNFELQPTRILVNLSPARVRKEGAHLDLAIAIALMVNFGYVEVEPKFLEKFCLLGELSLIGEIKSVTGALALAIEADNHKIKYLIVSPANSAEASLITLLKNKQIEVFQATSLLEVKELIEELYQREAQSKTLVQSKIPKCSIKAVDKKQIKFKHSNSLDLSDVVGQEHAKRGLEIAAAGSHHLLMIGPPGCGKSMLAKRFISLIPELSFEKALETTKIYSVAGLVKTEISFDPPLRAPHHSASATALIGGGLPIRPGEVSLAHNGVLFLDELTEFGKFTIEQLRQVLENKEITLNRIHQSITYPADFIMIAACNPCPCGHLGDRSKQCQCSPQQIKNYLGKLSGPLLDRIDIHIEMSRLDSAEIKTLSQKYTTQVKSEPKPESQSNSVKARILLAQKFSASESLGYKLDKDALELLDSSVLNLKLSARAHQKIVRIARTIANLAQSPIILAEHLAEALQFRSVNWDSFGG